MAPSWINLLLAVAVAMTLATVVVNGNEFTTVPLEKQAELEKLENNDENVFEDFSGDVDPSLEEKANKTFTTPTIKTTKQDTVEDTEAVDGVFSSEQSYETTTESQDDGSGDVDFFATEFPKNIQHALNETQDKELLPASDGTTAATTAEVFAPVLVDRKPVNRRPEQDPETTATEKPTTVQDKDDSVYAVPAKAPEVHSKSGAELHDVHESEELQPATTAAPHDPSAQATKGNPPISRGVIVGIVIIGVIALLALIILLVYLLVFRPRRKSLKHEVDSPNHKENGIANGAPKNNEESMTALVKELKDNKLSGKDKAYGTELKDDQEVAKLNGTTDRNDSPV